MRWRAGLPCLAAAAALACGTGSGDGTDVPFGLDATHADARPDAADAGPGETSPDLADPDASDPAEPADVPGLDLAGPADLPGDEPAQDTVWLDAPLPDAPADAAADTPAPDVRDAADPIDAPPPDAGPPTYGPAGTPFPIAGFGAGTLGGFQDGHDTYTVTSLADDGPGSLREGLRTGDQPRVVVFAVDGAITSLSPLIVPSNITIDGRGRDITLRGMGLVIPGTDQVILVNLALEDIGPESQDGVQIGSALPDPSENVVLDHLRFTQHGDGGNCENVDEAVSIVFGSRNLTVAWCRFDNWEKVLLAGNGDAEPALDAQITLTWHHSYARATGRRHPQARHGRFHLFNNFWDDWRMYGWEFLPPYHESFGSQVQDGGRMLLQGQMVRRDPHDYEVIGNTANDASRCESGGDLLETGTWVDPASTAPLRFRVGCAGKQAFEPPYAVEVEEAGPALRDRVVAGAGNTLL